MSQIGRELQLTLQSAFREAVVHRNAYITVEHLLFAMLHNEAGIDIMRSSGAQVDKLRAELEHDLAVLRRETNSWRWPLFAFGYLLTLAYGASFATYRIVGSLTIW